MGDASPEACLPKAEVESGAAMTGKALGSETFVASDHKEKAEPSRLLP